MCHALNFEISYTWITQNPYQNKENVTLENSLMSLLRQSPLQTAPEAITTMIIFTMYLFCLFLKFIQANYMIWTLCIKLPFTQHNVKKNLSMLVLESVVHSFYCWNLSIAWIYNGSAFHPLVQFCASLNWAIVSISVKEFCWSRLSFI